MTAAVLPAIAPSASVLSRARHATRAQFAALGLLTGAWGAHIPTLKAQYAIGAGTLSLVLLAAAAGAVLSLFFAGRVIGRLGVRAALGWAAGAMTALLALVLHWPGLAALLPAMVLFGAAMSLFDVAINTEGSMLEVLSGRTVMSSLHGMFSVGGMAGAALMALLLEARVAPAAQLAGMSLGILLLVLLASRLMLDGRAHDDDARSAGDADGAGGPAKARFAWPRGVLLVIGLLIFAGMTAEGAMYDWSVLYLKQELHLPQAQAALGYAVFSAAMAAARFGGDWLRARVPERTLLRNSAAVSALAMAALLLVGQPWVAYVGYALVGIGLAPVVPILFNAATKVPGVSRAAAIAAASSIGYAGFMLGPPLIGALAQAVSLTAALGVVVVAAALLALGARRIPA
jgi:fucose permease